MSEPGPQRPKILIVDDTPTKRVALRAVLARLEVELIEAGDGAQALAMAQQHDFALILLDVMMPGVDGFEVARRLGGHPHTRQVPVMFVTAVAHEEIDRLRGYGAGAVDYITTPINHDILLSKVRVFVELHNHRERQQALVERLEQKSIILQRAEAEARHLALHDPLTGLPNRLLFMDRLENALQRCLRHRSACALLYIDVDGFKVVNDRHGHAAGDALLRAFATRLSEALRPVDTAARLGGDEFAVILESPCDRRQALQVSQRLCGRLAEPYAASGAAPAWQVSASIGVASYPEHAAALDELLRQADNAMYQAKQSGKNRVVIAGEAAAG